MKAVALHTPADFSYGYRPMNSSANPGSSHVTVKNLAFALVTFVFVLIAHAVAYLTHEYSHSLTAWSLGWMKQPFGIDYGPATVSNIIFLGDVSDNVDYSPILTSGNGLSAALIALAGPFVGNGLLYFILYGLTSTSFIKSRRFVLAFSYWLSLMCAANVWGYVPIRAITTHADIAIAAQGLGISTWGLFPFVMLVSGYITYHFFCRMFPKVYQAVAGGVEGNLALLIAFTSFWYFSFYGADGISGSYGFISQILSITSRYLLFPLCVVYLSLRYAIGNWIRHQPVQ
jgi:hypothetical protein